MKNPARHEAICNLITLGIEQCEEIKLVSQEGETKEVYQGIIDTLDRLEDMGLDKATSWDIICGGAFSLLEVKL